MHIGQILEGLQSSTGTFPRQALKDAIGSKDEITPALLKIIEDATQNPEVLCDEDYMAHVYAMLLLAQFREKRAYPLIVGFFSMPGEVAAESTGDVATAYLHRILASVSHGDAGLTRSLAENDDVSEWVRGAALDAMVTRVARGEATRRVMRSGLFDQPFSWGPDKGAFARLEQSCKLQHRSVPRGSSAGYPASI